MRECVANVYSIINKRAGLYVILMKLRPIDIFNIVPFLLLVIVTGLSLVGATPQGFIKIVYMAVLIQAPGFYITKMVGRHYHLQIDEFIASNIIFSGLTLLFSYIAISSICSQATAQLLWTTLTLVALVSAIGYSMGSREESETIISEVYTLAALLVCYLPSMVITTLALPLEYWRGSDAWETHSIVSSLVSNSMSPPELISYWESFVYLYNFGYYYLLAAFSLATGFSVDSILRFGGVFQSALLAVITYVSVKKMVGAIWGVLASWIIFLNPLMVLRWVTPIRENFSILLLFFVVYYIQLVKASRDCSRLLNILVYIAVLIASVMIHTLTPLFVLGVYLFEGLSRYLDGLREDALEFGVSVASAVLLLALFCPYTADPFTSFVRNNPATLTLVVLGTLALVTGAMLLKRFNVIKIMQIWQIRVFMIASIVLTVALVIMHPPDLGFEYSYGYIELDNFSLPFLFLSLMGAFSFVDRRVPLAVEAITFMVSASLVASYLGVEVPLSRLVMYITWVMSYVIVHFISTMCKPVELEIRDSSIRGLIRKSIEWSKANRIILIILLVFAIISVNDVGHQRRFLPTYSSFEVESAKTFVESLGEGDLVYAQSEAEILLYFLGVPRSNIVHEPAKEQALSTIFMESSPHVVSKLVQENYPDAKKFHVVLQGHESMAISEEPVATLFQFYTLNRHYGSTYVYSLSVPFTLEAIEPQNVKFIEMLGDGPIVGDGGSGAWEQSISSVSNIVFEPGETQPFKMYYAGIDAEGENYLGLAYSSDGVSWSKHGEPLNAGYLRYLYLVQDGGKLYLFCQRTSDQSLIRLESIDGFSWGNESLLFTSSLEETTRVQESPVIWKENGSWHMLFWELSIGPDTYNHGMIYANSSDGLYWGAHRGLINWMLFDSTYRSYEYEKILPMDITRTGDGYLVIARCLSRDLSQREAWMVCSIYIADSVFNTDASYNSLFFKELMDASKIDTVHRVFNPIKSWTQFFYVDYDGYDSQGTTNGVIIGLVSDHLNIPKEKITLP